MPTVTLAFASSHITSHPGCSSYGKWFKIPAYFAATTTVIDLNGGASGYLRCKMSNAGILTAEAVLGGATYSVPLGVAAPLGQWNWLAVSVGAVSTIMRVALSLRGPGGVLISVNTQDVSVPGLNTTIQAALGEGVSLSSAYANWPNDGVSLHSKMIYAGQDGFLNGGISDIILLGEPTADTAPLINYTGEYMARQSVGAATQLTDSSGNALHLPAGPQGLTIVQDGPYAS